MLPLAFGTRHPVWATPALDCHSAARPRLAAVLLAAGLVCLGAIHDRRTAASADEVLKHRPPI